ncbi:anthranilate phosphoribosyltransferase [Candidatus Nitrosotenuis cloacae]|uniref:Anthranilate phosphoribosyltransferase n=1 Tax=Candidatus Nitrosotenuis cloacae TaxID=1603555 RepID=A0A3G1B0X3_9ARCH|nr:anthranilate phosphoribosyltransferase [Candidatus Nitrosotenuis cloacae]AJZ75292.1 anthranilate phosphoribosyltransferase [Candidatus Nitrosotenuis cloacae]
MLENYIARLEVGANLTSNEMHNAMKLLLVEGETDELKAAFLQNLTKKGETDEELTAMLAKMEEYGVHIQPKCKGTIIDVCGTGGDKLHTFNISTTAAFVVASCGGIVAKHGNRSVSGISGSADIFEYFGYDLNADAATITSIIEKHRIGFLFAQRFHPAMKNVAASRKLLNTRTAFNLLGPLCNPARVKHQLIGVYSEEYLNRIVDILKKRGAQNIMTVHSQDGLDELSTTSKNKVCFLRDGKIGETIIDAQRFGLHQATIKDLQISSKQEAINAFVSVLKGTASQAMIEITALNAAGGLIVANLAQDFEEGLEMANESLKSGNAYTHFENFIKDCGDHTKLEGL